MTLLFENRITEAGKKATQDLIDNLAQGLSRTIELYGEDSSETLQCLLAFISIEQIMEPNEASHARIYRYLDLSEKISGRQSVETANGFLILGWSHAGLGRDEEMGLAMGQALSHPKGKRDFFPVEPMLEAL